MIQLRRGKTTSWRKNKFKLSAGQPGYDKDKHKIKIGDGEKYWTELPYASGLFEEDIFNSEEKAKIRYAHDSEDTTIITYGTEGPDEKTIGKVYLQYYETAPEVDYVVDYGVDGIWMYRKWNSGRAECIGALDLTTSIQSPFDNELLYHSDIDTNTIAYPFAFTRVPQESVTLQSTGNVVWLAGKTINTLKSTGKYLLISTYNCASAKYKIVFHVNGYWK